MYSGLLHAHSGFRWLVLLFICFALFNALVKRNQFGDKEKRVALLAMVMCHIQFVIGLVLYFVSPKVLFSGEMMSQSYYRFYTVEHFVAMLLAIILITIGRKKALLAETASSSNKKILTFYSVGLLIILAMIPWPFREILAGGWF